MQQLKMYSAGAFRDFMIFTPFTTAEVADTLELSARDLELAIASGALQSHVQGNDDPFTRMRFHSFWDIMEFELLLRAGWPLNFNDEVRCYISRLCDELAHWLDAEIEYDVDQLLNTEGFDKDSLCPPSLERISSPLEYIERSIKSVAKLLTTKLLLKATMTPS